ncbi:RluA family pseudouridine synthase [Bacteroidetes bacterium endosymbiont of Geopemphigus sp.]|uniref:RluA family pseudouridine synthase n=1 Tax=Bacteroidetes bacterium endosymbiont of Geopemphigus sp. TaxID=2047937 RepID=UPI000CD02091|nr:RluA family pseudouridine synthase [Bacteroidetes bacterium endosymbiont of Geopemphigus sp.]
MPEEIHDESSEEASHYEHFRFIADKGQEPLRIDKFLVNFIERATRNKIQNAARVGNILANNQPVKQNYRVKPLDVVRVMMAHPPRSLKILSENISLDIIYEDDALAVVNKSAGMVVHPGHGNYNGTLLNALKYHFATKNKVNFLDRMGLVHRIDKDTSGLLVVAKDDYSLQHLARQFFRRSIQRHYLALVWGNLETSGTIRGNIGRSLHNRQRMEVFPEDSYGKLAITHYEIIKKLGYVTLISCRLETGRTHQIRAHLKHMGHPLFNDTRYGGDKILKGTTFAKYQQFVKNCFSLLQGQFLHAQSLGFIHPMSGKFMCFEAPLPQEMAEVLKKWYSYSTHTQNEKM